MILFKFWLTIWAVRCITDTSTMPNSVQEYFNRVLLLRAIPNLVHVLFGKRSAIPKNAGEKMTFTRVSKFPVASTPLSEGVNPAAVDAGRDKVTATVQPYGQGTKISGLKELTEQSAVLNDISDALGDNMGESLDVVCRDTINGGSSALYANSVTGRANVITAVSKDDLDKLIIQLASGEAKPQTTMYKPENGGLTAIEACFPVIVHPHLKAQIRTVCGSNFTPTKDYPAGTPLFPGEFGSYDNLRFIATTNAKIWADSGAAVGTSGLRSTSGANVDVYSILAIGRDAFGVVPLADTDNVKLIVHTKEEAGGLLDMYGTAGWKAYVDYVILNDSFMARLESGAPA